MNSIIEAQQEFLEFAVPMVDRHLRLIIHKFYLPHGIVTDHSRNKKEDDINAKLNYQERINRLDQQRNQKLN